MIMPSRFMGATVDERFRVLEAMLQSTRDLLLIFDEQGTIRLGNLALTELLGVSSKEIRKMRLGDLLESPYKEEAIARLARDIAGIPETSRGAAFRVMLRGKHGRTLPASLTMSRVRHRDQRLFFGLFRDLTNVLDVERDLEIRAVEIRRSNVELESFASTMAVKLTPCLTKAESVIERLSSASLGKKPSFCSKLREVVDQIRHLRSLVRNLSSFSEKKPSVMTSPVALEELLDEVHAELIVPAGGSISIRRRHVLPRVLGVRSELKTLMAVLLENAVKFSRDDVESTVDIEAVDFGTHWTISMTDNGIGIPSRHAENIFRMSRRLHSRSEYPGRGMGLALAKRIVDAHEGTIGVESVVGRGSRFFFNLPKVPAD